MASPEVEAALKEQETDKRIKDLERTVQGLIDDREKAMRRGIVALGMAVVGMGTWIVNLFTGGHIR